MTNIIIFTGKKQSGKDTSALAFINSLPETERPLVKQYSFAEPLKNFLINVFGFDFEQCYGTDEEKNSLTKIKWINLPFDVETIQKLFKSARPNDPMFDLDTRMTAREVMQIFGSNVCRKMYNDCWAQATLNKILTDKPEYALITDARFPNELEVFKPYKPIIIRLSRDLFHSTHISETALDGYDFSSFDDYGVIMNDNMTLETKNKWVVSCIQDALEARK